MLHGRGAVHHRVSDLVTFSERLGRVGWFVGVGLRVGVLV